jgi:MarR family 2-MHQ and catechol resistance regulon transcriptional repressor
MAKSGNLHKKETRVLRLFHTIRSTADQLEAATLSLLSQSSLTLSQFLVMESLAHNGPMNQKTIGTHIGRSGGNITMVIRNLVKAGYVRQERFGADGRQRRISMTSEGYDLFMKVYPVFIVTYINMFKPLVGKDQKRLIKLCASISPNISVDGLDDDDDVTANDPNTATT